MRNVDEISYEYVIKIHGYKYERRNCCISNLLAIARNPHEMRQEQIWDQECSLLQPGQMIWPWA